MDYERAPEQDNLPNWRDKLGRDTVYNPYSRQDVDLSAFRFVDGTMGMYPSYNFVEGPMEGPLGEYRDITCIFVPDVKIWVRLHFFEMQHGSTFRLMPELDAMKPEDLNLHQRQYLAAAE